MRARLIPWLVVALSLAASIARADFRQAAVDYEAKARQLWDDADNRDLVASDLVKDPSPDALGVIERGLVPGGSEDVALALVKAITYYRDGRPIDAMLLLYGTDTRERIHAALDESLLALLDTPSEKRLLALAADAARPLPVRRSAVEFLGQCKSFDRPVIEGLIDLLSTSAEIFSSGGGANLITEALGRLAPVALGPDPSEWRQWWEKVRDRSDSEIFGEVLRGERERAIQFRKDAVAAKEALLDLLRSRKDEESAYLAELISAIRGAEYPEVQSYSLARLRDLHLALKDRTESAPETAQKTIVDLLTSLLADSRTDRTVVIAVIETLAVVAGPDQHAGSEFLVLNDKASRAIASLCRPEFPEDVAVAAVKALGRLKNPVAIGLLLARLNESATPAGAGTDGAPSQQGDSIREEIVLSLGEIGAPDAERALEKALLARDAESAVLRENAAIALGRLHRSTSVASLSDALSNDSEPKVRWRAADALTGIGGSGVEAALVKGLADPAKEVRKQCAVGLGMLKSRASVAPLTSLLSDAEGVVKEAALGSLAAIGDPQPLKAILLLIEDPSDRVALAAQKAFVAVLAGEAPSLIREVNGFVKDGKQKLALDILRLARGAILADGSGWEPKQRLLVERAYLDELVRSGTEENRREAGAVADKLADDSAIDPATRVELRHLQATLLIGLKNYDDAVAILTRLSGQGVGIDKERLYAIYRDLGRAYLEIGKDRGDLKALAHGDRLLYLSFPPGVPEALRKDGALIEKQTRDLFVERVSVRLRNAASPEANTDDEDGGPTEDLFVDPDFVETLLDVLLTTDDVVLVRSAARVMRRIAPDAPTLSETATVTERTREIESLRKAWSKRLEHAASR